MTLGVGESGYAKPNELAEFLAEGLRYPAFGMPFHRKEMYRLEEDGRRTEALDI
jgi:hypothetical protein